MSSPYPIVGAWLPWFRPATQPRLISVRDPWTGATRWTAPRNLTASGAQNWIADEKERAWNQDVTLYTYTGSGWRVGV